MERKIGEIFEYNGEWYQCVESDNCGECSPFTTECSSGTKSDLAYKVFGKCSKTRRSDNKQVIFKKLEKVGEPYRYMGKVVQKYKTCCGSVIADSGIVEKCTHGTVDIVIKQNKEDMEEKKLNLKPFDIQKAKAGKPVCTRDGRKARIICFDRKSHYPIIALVETFVKEYNSVREDSYYYTINGRAIDIENESKDDLMMLSEKKEGWVNVHKGLVCTSVYPRIYKSREEAVSDNTTVNRIDTVKISWEE